MFDFITPLDVRILEFVQDHLRNGVLTPIMKAASFLGDFGMIWIAIILALIVVKRTRVRGIVCGVSLAAEYVIVDMILKHLFMRTRPYLDHSQLVLLVKPETSTSFPSGHTASSFVCAYAITCLFGIKGAPSYILAALIGLSRIYVAVHYPSDVLVGAIVGTLVGVIVCAIYKAIAKKSANRISSGHGGKHLAK